MRLLCYTQSDIIVLDYRLQYVKDTKEQSLKNKTKEDSNSENKIKSYKIANSKKAGKEKR